MSEKLKTVYIAGKITGDPHYKSKFESAERKLVETGFSVMNPTILPNGFAYDVYMAIGKEMLLACDYVCFLPDWKESKGAVIEMETALLAEKYIFFYDLFEAFGDHNQLKG